MASITQGVLALPRDRGRKRFGGGEAFWPYLAVAAAGLALAAAVLAVTTARIHVERERAEAGARREALLLALAYAEHVALALGAGDKPAARDFHFPGYGADDVETSLARGDGLAPHPPAPDAAHPGERSFAQRPVPGYPLVATIGLSREKALAGFFAKRREEWITAALRVLVILALTAAGIAAVRWKRRSVRRLARLESRYRQVFETTTDCMFILEVTADERYRFEALNPAEERAMGLTTAQVAGRYVEDVLPASTARAVIDRYRTCLRAGAAIRYEQRLELAEGMLEFSTTLVPLRDGSGRIAAIVGVGRDITEVKHAQEAVRTLNRELEKRVAERTHELEANEALAAAIEEAERASLAKTAFLARVSHEIRTPMNGLLGALELLAQSGLSSPDAELVNGARDSGNLLLALLNDVLDMARIEAGRVEVAAGPTSLAALLEGVLATHRANAHRKGLAIGAPWTSGSPSGWSRTTCTSDRFSETS